ncbi:MAG: VWA domain-containing protein, partial [Ruminococcus sp.]|nr:VWA domain-containing protein [Ruminococcus sp.]
MKNNDKFNDAHDAFVQSLRMSARKKRRKIITIVTAIVVVIVGYIVLSTWIKHNREIDSAKSSMKQIDINSTFKDAEFVPGGDWDLDGVKNSDEKDRGTNVQNEDTDGDGISDGDEKELGTDPLKEDTDGDGILDGYELIAGLDPLKKMSDGKTDDAKREMTIEKKSGEVTL